MEGIELEAEFEICVQEYEPAKRIERLEFQKEMTEENLKEWDKLISLLETAKNKIKDCDIQNEINKFLCNVREKKGWSEDILEEQEQSIRFVRGY